MTGPPLTPALWLAAVAPVAVLFVLVASGRVRTQVAATVVAALTVVLGVTVFRAGPLVALVAVAKGLWLGLWILLVVWFALLLYRIAAVAGLERIGEIFTSVLPRRRENLLLVAWLFPSFIQGVAGFGTPIAVAAPLLLAMGWSPVQAVVYPLIGYHWSVTFGSMGSSFYMASLTAHLSVAEQARFATLAALLLGGGALVAGAAVLYMDGRWQGVREGARVLLAAGLPLAATLVLVARIVPAVATLAASAVGFVAVFLLARARRPVPAAVGGSTAPDPAAVRPSQVLSPYLYLLATSLPVFLWPPARAWVRSHLLLAPDFPATTSAYGWANPAAVDYTPIALLGHPGFYILLACILGYATYRRVGLWHDTDSRALVADWLRALPKASAPILLLACVATVLIDSGMVSVLARGITAATGPAYPLLAPLIGALGSFMTGSTTTSNALFAALQRDVAVLLDVPPPILLAAQTAGGNAGNSLAPVVILIGATAAGIPDRVSAILRRSLRPATLLLALLALATMLLVLTIP